MKTLYQRLLEAIDARSLRERLLLLAASAAVVILLTDALFISPAQKRVRADSAQLAAVRAEIATLEASAILLQQQLDDDPDADTRARIDTLSTAISAERDRLTSAVARFIDPVQMNRLLQTMVAGHDGLDVVAVRSAPPRPLLNDTVEQPGASPADTAKVWQRPVEIELAGAYRAMLAYLQALEALPWELRWDALTVSGEGESPPRFIVRLHTLSLTSEWIGG